MSLQGTERKYETRSNSAMRTSDKLKMIVEELEKILRNTRDYPRRASSLIDVLRNEQKESSTRSTGYHRAMHSILTESRRNDCTAQFISNELMVALHDNKPFKSIVKQIKALHKKVFESMRRRGFEYVCPCDTEECELLYITFFRIVISEIEKELDLTWDRHV